MEMQYFKSYSEALGRDMECKVYGHAGLPVLFIPCQDGRFFDFENYKRVDVWAPWIERGEVMVIAIDTIDKETWSDKFGDSYWRIRRHEEWMSYIVNEVAPFIRALSMERNGWDEYPGIIVFGCSLGATHAANLYFRFPETFTGMLALSGIYTGEYGFGSYMDEYVYANSPIHYLENMPADHPYIEKINKNYGIICVGLGPWEVPETSLKLREIFYHKGINVWVDIWGHDVQHDWPWWYKQVEYFLPKLLEA